jgi:alanine dehydrogenase
MHLSARPPCAAVRARPYRLDGRGRFTAVDLRLGVVATSRKENEFRLPLHPSHIARIEPSLRARLLLEHGYGERFGFADDELAPLVSRLAPRAELIASCDVVLLPKPLEADLAEMRAGQVLCGGPHTVQQEGKRSSPSSGG